VAVRKYPYATIDSNKEFEDGFYERIATG